MDLGSMMGDLITNAGHAQIAGAQQEMRQAQADDTRAQAQMRQMSALSMKQDVADRKAITDETKASSEEFQRSSKTSADIQKLANAKEGSAIAHNQFGMAKEYGEMAKMAEAEQQTALKNKAEEAHQKNEGVANTAAAYEANPSTENAKALAAQAAAAGQQNIPATGTPEFASWAVAQKTAAMDSAKRLEWSQKEADIKEKQKETERSHQANEAIRLEGIRATALAREQLEEGRNARAAETRVNKERLQLDREKWQSEQADKKAATKAAGGAKVGAIEQKVSDTIIRNSAQGVRVIDNMLSVPSSAANSLFGSMKDVTLTDSLVRTGGNFLTKEADQEVTAIGAEMGVIIGQVVTAGSGRGASLPIIQSFQKMTTPQQGDTPHMKLMRLANAGEILQLELTNITPGATKELEDSRSRMLKFLDKLPTTKDVLRLTPAKERGQTMQQYADLQKKIGDTRGQASALPKETETAPAAALPAGWH